MPRWLVWLLVLALILAVAGLGLLMFLDDGSAGILQPEEASGRGEKDLGKPEGKGLEGTGIEAETPGRKRQTLPRGPGSPRNLPITLAAEDAVTRRALAGLRFTYRLRSGGELLEEKQATSPHLLHLEWPRNYRLEVEARGYIPPGVTEFALAKDSKDVTIRLPFSRYPGEVELEVLDQAGNTRLEHFRYTLLLRGVTRDGNSKRHGIAKENPLLLGLELEQDYELRIEAEGYQPAEPIAFKLAAHTPRISKRIFLAKTMLAAGVELRAEDEQRRPVTNLAVEVERQQADLSFELLWKRQDSKTDGHYKLPDLRPGTYRFKLRALDQEGMPLLLIPEQLQLELLGSEQVIKTIRFELGAAIRLRLTDDQNRLIAKDVRINLIHPDDKVHPSRWLQLVPKPDPKLGPRLGINCLAGKGEALLYDPVAAGNYVLMLQWGKGPVREETFDLVAGRTTAAELQLRQ